MSLQAQWRRALVAPESPPLTGLATWNGSDPAQRFKVYRNNVAHSLVDALADSFGVVQTLVGEEFFRAMARVYALADPPRSPVLSRWGSGFANFIDGFAPAAGLPYLADMARLEFAQQQATHARDVQLLQATDLRAVLAAPETLAGLRLSLHPSVWTYRSPYAIASLWLAHQDGGDIGAVDMETSECVLVWRQGSNAHSAAVSLGMHAFVKALAADQLLGDAAAAALAVDADFDLGPCLATLLHAQALRAPDQPLSPENP